MPRHLVSGFLLALLLACGAGAEPLTAGRDMFLAGPDAAATPSAPRDLFAAGFNVSLGNAVAEDAHIAGFSVASSGRVAGDLYAAGGSVRIGAAVGGDLSALGFLVETGQGAEVSGNARLSGGTVRVAAPVRGALMASGGEVALAAPVDGDVWIAAERMRFDEGASIGGTLTYAAPERFDIPESVIPADRVRYEPLDHEVMRDAADHWDRDWPMPGPLSVAFGALVVLAFLALLGALLLALAPRQVEAARLRAMARPGMTLLFGVIGLSALFGLVPVAIMAVIGIPFLPFILLGLVVVWTLGYLLGAYALAVRVLDAFREDDREHGPWMRLGAMMLGIALLALVNFVPVLGWMANFAVALLGIGAMTSLLTDRLTPRPARAEPPRAG